MKQSSATRALQRPAMTPRPGPIGRLRMAYLIALTAVAVLSLSVQLVIHRTIALQESDAPVITIAGRQRMLCQQIAKDALAIQRALSHPDQRSELASYRNQLAEALTLLVASHEGLIHSDPSQNLPGTNSKAVHDLFDRLQPYYQQVRQAAGQLLAETDRAETAPESLDVPRIDAQVDIILEQTDTFLPMMTQIVFQYGAEAQDRVEGLRRIEQVIGLVTLLVLLAEATLVFEPAVWMIRRALHEAEEANRAKDEFLANVSHEIRTPLNGVIGMTYVVLNSKISNSTRHHIEIIRTSGETLLTLINQILDFSKLRSGNLELDRVEFSIDELIEEIAEMLAVRAHAKGLELACRIDRAMPARLRGDPVRIRQILFNLGSNAVKFTHEGEVQITAEAPTQNRDRVILRLIVQDTGIGIPPEKHAAIFESFRQVDASTTRKYGGTGLGLAITRQLVERMGGTIDLESRLGRGSRFTITLTLPIVSTAKSLKRLPSATVLQRTLIVDDNATNRLILGELLEGWGLRHSVADSALEALTMLRRAAGQGDPFRLVLTDFQMPERDGIELTRKIRSEFDPDAPTIVLFSSLDAASSRIADPGFAARLTKPIRAARLFTCLEQLANGSALKPDDSEPQPISEATTQLIGLDHIRILLVEDDLLNQKVSRLVLKRLLGREPDLVVNGLEAVERLRTQRYDLVLMDCMMPVLDGYEATRQIRDPASAVLDPQVRIVAMTANALEPDRRRCLEAGMDDHLPKPIRVEQLREVLNHFRRPNIEQQSCISA